MTLYNRIMYSVFKMSLQYSKLRDNRYFLIKFWMIFLAFWENSLNFGVQVSPQNFEKMKLNIVLSFVILKNNIVKHKLYITYTYLYLIIFI